MAHSRLISPRRYRTWVLALSALALPLGACGPDAAPGPSELPRRVLVRPPEVRIGSLDDPDQALVAVGDLAVGPGGRVWVAQSSDGQVHAFSPRGTPVRRVGRAGEGPGELQSVSRLGFVGDTLWVADSRQRRVSLFDTTGALVRDFRYPDDVPGLAEGIRVGLGAVLPGRRLVMVTSAGFGSDLEYTDHPFPLLVTDEEGERPMAVATRYAAHDRAMLTTAAPDGSLASVQIFQQRWSDVTLWTVVPGTADLVLVDRHAGIAYGDQGNGGGGASGGASGGEGPPAYRVTRVGPRADTAWSVTVPWEPTPVPAHLVDSLVDRMARGEVSEAQLRDLLFLPEFWPPVEDVVAAPDGTVWVGREVLPDATVRPWDVLSPGGDPTMRVEAPAGLEIMAVDEDGVWGVETDELEVPYVVRYVLGSEPSSGGGG